MTKVRPLPEERVRSELEWFGQHRVDYLDNADANWGILKRDLALTKATVETKKTYGFPRTFRTSFTKNSNDQVWEIANLLHQAGMLKAVTLAMQSMDQDVLQNIHRKNIKFDHFGELVKKYEDAGIPTYTELIMGLPGETYDSYVDGIERNLEAGQHSGLFMYMNLMLPNTEQTKPEYREKYGLKTVWMQAMLTHGTPELGVVREKQEIIVETKAMPFGRWKSAWMYSKIVEIFHCQGLLQETAIFCRDAYGIKYKDFYTKLWTWLQLNPGTIAGEEWLELVILLNRAISGDSWDCVDPSLGSISWPPEEFAFARICLDLDRFWKEIKEFYLDLPVSEKMAMSLWEDQRTRIKGPSPGEDTAEWAKQCVWYNRKGNRTKSLKGE